MKLKFHKQYEGPLPEDTKLYLKCPKCDQVSLWDDYPSNPSAPSVQCVRCGFLGMGCHFEKAIVRIKKPTDTEIRQLLKSHKQFTTGPLADGQFEQFHAVVKILAGNRPLMRVLHDLSDSQDEKLIRKGRRWGLISKQGDTYSLTATGKKVLAEATDFNWF